ncbi:MAG: VOC family protein [Pseudomonadota bacterium]|nr:VOC family protein [Pseudomonadota bacterium]
MIHAMNHFTVLADDLEATLAFYVGVLGLEPGPRPELGFPGAWLYASGQAVLHIVAGRPMPAQRSGVLDHMAFSASGLADVTRRLDAASIAYTLRRQTGSKLWQLFCVDPSGARVELDFDASETP